MTLGGFPVTPGSVAEAALAFLEVLVCVVLAFGVTGGWKPPAHPRLGGLASQAWEVFLFLAFLLALVWVAWMTGTIQPSPGS